MKEHIYKVIIFREDNNDKWEYEFNNLNSAKAFVRKENKKSFPWIQYKILTNDNKLVYKVKRVAFDVEFIKEEKENV